MLPAFRAPFNGAELGAPLPVRWRTFEQNKVRFYQGDLSMIAGPPACGKSVIAMNLALTSGVPTLYIMCDMGRFKTAVRAASIVTGVPQESVRADLETDAGVRKYADAMKKVSNVWFEFDSSPTPAEIAEMVEAFEVVWGIPPRLVVLDNLMNLHSGNENEWSGLRDLAKVFHYLATELGSHVMLLHHLNLGGLNMGYPGPINSLKGQISELPSIIITVTRGQGEILLAKVKNRDGDCDPTGRSWFSLAFDGPTVRLSDPAPPRSRHEDWRDRVSG